MSLAKVARLPRNIKSAAVLTASNAVRLLAWEVKFAPGQFHRYNLVLKNNFSNSHVLIPGPYVRAFIGWLADSLLPSIGRGGRYVHCAAASADDFTFFARGPNYGVCNIFTARPVPLAHGEPPLFCLSCSSDPVSPRVFFTLHDIQTLCDQQESVASHTVTMTRTSSAKAWAKQQPSDAAGRSSSIDVQLASLCKQLKESVAPEPEDPELASARHREVLCLAEAAFGLPPSASASSSGLSFGSDSSPLDNPDATGSREEATGGAGFSVLDHVVEQQPRPQQSSDSVDVSVSSSATYETTPSARQSVPSPSSSRDSPPRIPSDALRAPSRVPPSGRHTQVGLAAAVSPPTSVPPVVPFHARQRFASTHKDETPQEPIFRKLLHLLAPARQSKPKSTDFAPIVLDRSRGGLSTSPEQLVVGLRAWLARAGAANAAPAASAPCSRRAKQGAAKERLPDAPRIAIVRVKTRTQPPAYYEGSVREALRATDEAVWSSLTTATDQVAKEYASNVQVFTMAVGCGKTEDLTAEQMATQLLGSAENTKIVLVISRWVGLDAFSQSSQKMLQALLQSCAAAFSVVDRAAFGAFVDRFARNASQLTAPVPMVIAHAMLAPWLRIPAGLARTDSLTQISSLSPVAHLPLSVARTTGSVPLGFGVFHASEPLGKKDFKSLFADSIVGQAGTGMNVVDLGRRWLSRKLLPYCAVPVSVALSRSHCITVEAREYHIRDAIAIECEKTNDLLRIPASLRMTEPDVVYDVPLQPDGLAAALQRNAPTTHGDWMVPEPSSALLPKDLFSRVYKNYGAEVLSIFRLIDFPVMQDVDMKAHPHCARVLARSDLAPSPANTSRFGAKFEAMAGIIAACSSSETIGVVAADESMAKLLVVMLCHAGYDAVKRGSCGLIARRKNGATPFTAATVPKHVVFYSLDALVGLSASDRTSVRWPVAWKTSSSQISVLLGAGTIESLCAEALMAAPRCDLI